MKSWKKKTSKVAQNSQLFFLVLAWLPKRPIFGRSRILTASMSLLIIYSLDITLIRKTCAHLLGWSILDKNHATHSPSLKWRQCSMCVWVILQAMKNKRSLIMEWKTEKRNPLVTNALQKDFFRQASYYAVLRIMEPNHFIMKPRLVQTLS